MASYRKCSRKGFPKGIKKCSRKSIKKGSRKGSRKLSKKGSLKRSPKKVLKGSKRDEAIKKYFRKEIKSYGKDYFLGSVWKHPISKKQVGIKDSDRKLFKQVKKEMKISGKRCNVKRSPTDKKEDLIKELRAYVRCWEKKTTRNQDLPMSRLKSESVGQIKKHLSFYRKENKY